MSVASGKQISIILPALNEEKTIGRVIDEIPRQDLEKRGFSVQVVVVDNNSTDRTKEIAQSKGAKVIVETKRGKGWAVRAAFDSVDGDFLFMLDSDYTYPATYIPQLLDVLQEGWDVVMGSRLRGHMEKGAMRRMNLAGNYLLVKLANLLYGTKITDLCTGMWGFNKNVVEAMKLDAIGFELEANIFVEIARKNCRIAEVPIYYRRRPTRAKLGTVRAGYLIARTLIVKRFR